MGTLSEAQLRAERRNITMIFQGFNLLMQRNCLRNVCFPLELAGVKKSQAQERAKELLELVGLGDKLKKLSVAAFRRSAAARCNCKSVGNPSEKFFLCDEATSALDPQTTQSILSLIRDIHKRLGITVIVITHQMSVVEQICTKVAILDGGSVVEEGNVSDVFASPKSKAAKALVFPEGYEQGAPLESDESVIRIVFNGSKATKTPIIAEMAMKEGIAASILGASTRAIGEKAYGNMLLGIPGGKAQLEKAMNYLKTIPDIYIEEVTGDDR